MNKTPPKPPASNSSDAVPESGSEAIRQWMKGDSAPVQLLNPLEMTSLTALVAYVAHITGQTEFRVERQFADRFNIPNVKCLPAEKYDDAIRYLVDQVPPATPAS